MKIHSNQPLPKSVTTAPKIDTFCPDPNDSIHQQITENGIGPRKENLLKSLWL